jgi:hypothetical protein
MPAISRFFGLTVYMYYNDHAPPHFHVEYNEWEAVYAIETLETLRGELPRRAHSMIVEWALMKRAQLRANWANAERQLPLEQIGPLE